MKRDHRHNLSIMLTQLLLSDSIKFLQTAWECWTPSQLHHSTLFCLFSMTQDIFQSLYDSYPRKITVAYSQSRHTKVETWKISEIFFFSTHISLMNQKEKKQAETFFRESGLRRVQPKLGKHIKNKLWEKIFSSLVFHSLSLLNKHKGALLIRRAWKPSGIVGKRLKRDMKRDVSYKRFHRPPQLALNEHFSFSTADLYTLFFLLNSLFLLFVRFFSHNC